MGDDEWFSHRLRERDVPLCRTLPLGGFEQKIIHRQAEKLRAKRTAKRHTTDHVFWPHSAKKASRNSQVVGPQQSTNWRVLPTSFSNFFPPEQNAATFVTDTLAHGAAVYDDCPPRPDLLPPHLVRTNICTANELLSPASSCPLLIPPPPSLQGRPLDNHSPHETRLPPAGRLLLAGRRVRPRHAPLRVAARAARSGPCGLAQLN